MAEYLIEYRKIGLLATCIGNERIRVDRDGGLYYSRNRHECKPGELWSDGWKQVGRLDSAAVRKLVQDIRDSGVLALPPSVIDDEFEGGKREELMLMIETVTHQYVVQNTDIPAFKKVVQLMWNTLFEYGVMN